MAGRPIRGRSWTPRGSGSGLQMRSQTKKRWTHLAWLQNGVIQTMLVGLVGGVPLAGAGRRHLQARVYVAGAKPLLWLGRFLPPCCAFPVSFLEPGVSVSPLAHSIVGSWCRDGPRQDWTRLDSSSRSSRFDRTDSLKQPARGVLCFPSASSRRRARRQVNIQLEEGRLCRGRCCCR